MPLIRADYTDPFYRALGKEAITQWRRNPIFTPYFHETGVLFHSSEDSPETAEYIDQGIENGAHPDDDGLERAADGKTLPGKAYRVMPRDEKKEYFPKAMRKHLGSFASKLGSSYPSYYNPRGGWAEARSATVAALKEAERLGAQVVGSADVCRLIYNGKRAEGVVTRDGRSFRTANGGAVIICAGAWTSKLAASILPAESSRALREPATSSAQSVITVQLDPETACDFKGTPVIFDVKSGFYTFEPDENGVLKAAIHDAGYTHPAPPFGVKSSEITYPSFSWCPEGSPPADADGDADAQGDGLMGGRNKGLAVDIARQPQPRHIPAGYEDHMFELLCERFPPLRTRATNLKSRVCWYSDTEDENWVIDHAPGPVENVILTTGDSGHGFKFLPTIGEYIAARLPAAARPRGIRELTPHQKRIWSIDYHLQLQAQAERQRHIDEHGGNARAKL